MKIWSRIPAKKSFFSYLEAHPELKEYKADWGPYFRAYYFTRGVGKGIFCRLCPLSCGRWILHTWVGGDPNPKLRYVITIGSLDELDDLVARRIRRGSWYMKLDWSHPVLPEMAKIGAALLARELEGEGLFS